MSRLQAFFYFCVMFIHFSDAFIEQFVYYDVSPKCCGPEEALMRNNSDSLLIPYKCVLDVNRTSHVLTSEVLAKFPWSLQEARSCLDDVVTNDPFERHPVKIEVTNGKTDMKLNYFPKCCPVNSTYDMYEHKCVEVTTNGTNNDFSSFTEENLMDYLDKGFFYLKIGLSKCLRGSAIADYKISSLKDIGYQENRAIEIDGIDRYIPYGKYCIDKVYDEESYVVRVCHEGYEVCRKNKNEKEKPRCVSKCCGDGFYYKGGGQCRFGFGNGINFANDSKVVNYEEPFAIIHGSTCKRYIVRTDWEYTLNETGFLNLNLTENKDKHSPFEDKYCFEEVSFGVIQGRRLFLCFQEVNNDSLKFRISRVTFSISSVFLFLTLMGYIFLPEMQNLHGKTLMCSCGSLLLAFIILVVLQFHPFVKGSGCTVVGYVIIYTFLSAFMWSNVMCFDIWWTFGSMRIHGIDQKKRECRRFIWYCVYAWTIPIPITLAAFAMQYFKKSLPESAQPFAPALGGFSCFFEESTNPAAFLTWFILPILLVCICNLVFFVKTIMYCYQVKNEINKMKDSLLSKNERKKILNADMERLGMVTKLFLVMGIPWLFEGISAATIPPNAKGALYIVEIVFDSINTLQGVYIFCIFILKTKFIRALKKKLGGKYFKAPTESILSAGTSSSYVPPSFKIQRT